MDVTESIKHIQYTFYTELEDQNSNGSMKDPE